MQKPAKLESTSKVGQQQAALTMQSADGKEQIEDRIDLHKT